MSDGFIWVWFAEWTPARRDALIVALAAAGISLAEPSSGEVRMFNPDDDPDRMGIPRAVERSELLSRMTLVERSTVSLQFWFGPPGHDLYTRVRRSAGGDVVVEFSLDGVYPADADRLAGAVATLPDVKAVVADRRGASEDEDWDAVVRGAKVPDFPEFLARP